MWRDPAVYRRHRKQLFYSDLTWESGLRSEYDSYSPDSRHPIIACRPVYVYDEPRVHDWQGKGGFNYFLAYFVFKNTIIGYF